MKGTLEAFARAVFGPEQRVRLRPGYFPFVEPGAEVDVSCFLCGGEGCRVCDEGWIEILGAGMVHPKVLENGGLDPERYTGFAAGLGIERITMLRHGVPDIRLFFDGDIRTLSQFARSA
jgi:phenylalanyl-tRNA synthetase alpha chain